MTETAKPNPIPDTYRRVTPCLVVPQTAPRTCWTSPSFRRWRRHGRRPRQGSC